MKQQFQEQGAQSSIQLGINEYPVTRFSSIIVNSFSGVKKYSIRNEVSGLLVEDEDGEVVYINSYKEAKERALHFKNHYSSMEG